MNRTLKSLLCGMLSSAMLITSTGCVSNISKEVKAEGIIEIWYENSETVVYQTESYETKNKSGLNISMAKNEYESGQIILTPTTDVKSYDIQVNNLVSGDNIIPVEDISVYMENYIYNPKEEMYIKGKPYYTTDVYVPDALIPFDAAKNAGENNIESGKNQGLYVTVKTSKDTDAGVYTGNFKITVDGAEYIVPVEVTVWDITVSDEVNTASIFMLYGDRLVNSLEGEATDEKLKVYYDFFLEHRLSLMYLPSATNDIDKFLELLKEYYENPAFSAYEIPYSCKLASDYGRNINAYGEPDLDELQDTVNRIVAMSIQEEKNYLEKAYIYNIYVDEFLLDSSKSTDKFKMGVSWVEKFNSWIERVVDALDTAYGTEYLDSVDGLRYSLEHLTLVNAGSDVQVGRHIPGETYGYNSVMPEPDAFNNEMVAEQLRSDWSEEGDEIWWYTCVGPVNPYPNYHLSNTYSLLDARLLSWMQYDQEIYGNLYWAVNNWRLSREIGTRTNTDIYNQQSGYGASEDNGGCYGDGLLVYPGAPYGLKEPVSTLRLESIRDGLEDYALLESVEDSYQELSTYYGFELNEDATLDTIFAKVYSGTISYKNEDNLSAARTSLFDTITSLKSDAKILLENAEASGDDYTASVLVSGDYEVTGDYVSKESCGQGYRYVFNYTRGIEDIYLNFTASNGENTITQNLLLERAPVTMISFTETSQIGEATLTKNTVAEIAQFAGKNVMKVHLASSALPSETATFKPKVEFKAEMFKDVLKVANQYTINLYNANDFDVQLIVTASSMTKKTTLRTITLKANSWNEVLISDTSAISTAVKISFEFENLVDQASSTAINYDIYFSNLAYKRS